ncbi:PREDICTED: uncharacterized protein LOC109326950 [Lupinus angustifolius]|uniref:uncharacterized protein LOC109326950 n=1 Tax=Lupinus angustifolius TaxID=3871 RepID=UPI00092EB975|nr:PREDICTED: uncharacterized protein LOC109326950 [Lupinus angustifolius]
MFGIACDCLWRTRNHLIFHDNATSATSLCNQIMFIASNVFKAYKDRINISNGSNTSRFISVRWFPPHEGWVKLNSDDSFSSASNQAACGVVIRDHFGSFLFSFARGLGSCFALHAKLWGIITGLELLQQRGFGKLLQSIEEGFIPLSFGFSHSPHFNTILSSYITKHLISRFTSAPHFTIHDSLQHHTFITAFSFLLAIDSRFIILSPQSSLPKASISSRIQMVAGSPPSEPEIIVAR